MDLSEALTETDPEDPEEGPSVMDKEILEETPTWIVDEDSVEILDSIMTEILEGDHHPDLDPSVEVKENLVILLEEDKEVSVAPVVLVEIKVDLEIPLVDSEALMIEEDLVETRVASETLLVDLVIPDLDPSAEVKEASVILEEDKEVPVVLVETKEVLETLLVDSEALETLLVGSEDLEILPVGSEALAVGEEADVLEELVLQELPILKADLETKALVSSRFF